MFLCYTEHEVLSQPSITAVDVMRKQLANRPEQPNSIAVLADPVYRAEGDQRLQQSAASLPQEIVESATERNLRSLSISNLSSTSLHA